MEAKETAAAQLEAIKIKYEEAVELRKKAELDIEIFRPVGTTLQVLSDDKFAMRKKKRYRSTMLCALQEVDKATSSRIVLEKKLEQLEVEIEFLKRIHQQVGQHVYAGTIQLSIFLSGS